MSDVERWLDTVRGAVPRRLRRRVVAELRHHLREDVAAGLAHGLERHEAERMTLARLGSPERIAAEFAAAAAAPRRGWVAFAALAAAVVLAVVAGVVVTGTRHAERPRTGSRPVPASRLHRELAAVIQAVYGRRSNCASAACASSRSTVATTATP